ncbi:CoA transferase [Nitratireductor sp. XY-223]|uniref:CaiB/BaiF CoA transferase family protein n=1 Tax=Nitratireductor sp. XY-223 TaxID=2561926 RepID=UPI0010AB24BC|nr:CoA transferase [Nitratireductor sp. XY-223]
MTERFSPLSGIRVIDLSKVLAGPLCTQYLGDLGADVIKIEPCGGDDTRAWPPFSGRDGAVYLSVNKNKRSLAINLKTDAGKRVVQNLVADADVLVESFRTGVTQRLGIDYDTMTKVKPDLIYASISGFGRSGPLAKEPGYDMMIQAFSGIMSITGEKGGGPVRSAFSPLDQTTGVHTALGILAALRHRDQTGQGQLIEASLYETALSFLGYPSQIYWTNGVQPKRLGSGHESVCPYQAFKASDGYILIAVGNDPLWKKLCSVLGYEELVDDPRYATNAARVENFDETVGLVADKVRNLTAEECAARLSEAGVPNSLLHSIEQSLNHPQAQARDMISKMPHPAVGEINALSMPLLFDGYDRKPRTAPPMLGEHTVELLEEAGLMRSEIDDLLRDGTALAAD